MTTAGDRPKPWKPNVADLRTIAYLKTCGVDGAAAVEVGAVIWPVRVGHTVAAQGGGDYAAQMLLGRLRKQGLARTLNTDGSSRWSLTTKGRGVAT
jgi:hypothetical protein